MLARPLSAPLPPGGESSGAAVARADRRHGKLLHGYLHKTSNSLCGIKGYASLIVDGIPLAGSTERWARKIIAEVEKLEAIYRSVQDMAFPQPTRTGGDDLETVLRRAVAAAERSHPQLAVRYGSCQAGVLRLPARDLELALGEILANSAEATAVGRRVQVTVRTVAREAQTLALVLRDDGPGLQPGLLSEATVPFVTTKPGHLGIGLARVDTLMDMHGLPWALRSLPGLGTAVELAVAAPYDDSGETAVEGAR